MTQPASLSSRHLWIPVRDMSPLSEAATERTVLPRRLVERDHEIVRRDLSGRAHACVRGRQHAQPLVLRTAGKERDLQQNQVIRIVQSQERPRMKELGRRQDVNDLEEIVRRNSQCAYQALLNGVRYPAETSLVVASFEDMDFGDGHLVVSSPWARSVRSRRCA